MVKNTTLKQKIILVIFGLFLFALLIEIGLRLAGFTYLSLQERKNIVSLSHKGAYRIMCLGGSTTAGGGGKDSYPSQLELILNQRIPNKHFSVINKGVPGINTTSILSQLKSNLDKYQPDMVIVMMGINDSKDRFVSLNRLRNFLKPFRVYKLARLFWKRTREITILAQIYLERGRDYHEERDYALAEEMLKRAIVLAPHDTRAYIELAACYRELREFTKAEEIAKKIVALAPHDAVSYIQLGYCYRDQEIQEKFAQAEKIFKKAIEVNPRFVEAYFELGWCYEDQRKYSQAEQMFRKAVELAPENERSYIELGWCYQEDGKFVLAEEMLKKAIEVKPEVDLNYIELGWFYQKHQKYSQAEQMFKKALSINEHNEQTYISLVLLSQAQGKDRDAEFYLKKAKLITEYCSDTVRLNYQKLRDIILKRGIKLVCMQYPLRSIKPLKEILGTNSGISYIDNEGIFNQALKTAKYEDYFSDRFAGDFGHCTPKGNRLIANNICAVLLKEYFSSPKSKNEK